MKAVVYEGPHQVSTKDVPDAKIERPTDVSPTSSPPATTPPRWPA